MIACEQTSSALTFGDFVPRLELLTLFSDFLGILGIFRDFRKSTKKRKMNYFSLFCKSYLLIFSTFIMPLLCCSSTDLGIFYTVLVIFGVAFVRALQTRLLAFELVGCFIKVFLGYTVLRSACIKKVPTSQRAGPRFARNSMLYGSSSQWSDRFNTSHIFLLMTSERRHRCLRKE